MPKVKLHQIKEQNQENDQNEIYTVKNGQVSVEEKGFAFDNKTIGADSNSNYNGAESSLGMGSF